MESPRPVPWFEPAVLVVKNGSKMRGRISGAMPGPESATRNSTSGSAARGRQHKTALDAGPRAVHSDFEFATAFHRFSRVDNQVQ